MLHACIANHMHSSQSIPQPGNPCQWYDSMVMIFHTTTMQFHIIKAGSISSLIKNQDQNQNLESKFTTKGVKLLYKNFIHYLAISEQSMLIITNCIKINMKWKMFKDSYQPDVCSASNSALTRQPLKFEWISKPKATAKSVFAFKPTATTTWSV